MRTVIDKREDGSRRVVSVPYGESRVERSHQERQNINCIMRRLRKGGQVPFAVGEASYGDFTSYGDFHSCLNRVVAAQSDFMSIPSEVRRRFGNDVGRMLDFVGDAENAVEARKLGLLPPEAAEGPIEPGGATGGSVEAPEAPSEPVP